MMLLENAQGDWDRCQNELTRLRELCRVVEGHQNVLQLYIKGIHSLKSPVHLLPPEILCQIFEYICCDRIGTNKFESATDVYLPTITLSRVCIGWYNLVTSMPVLWSSFGYRDDPSPPAQKLFTTFLERSQQHPIDFSIQIRNHPQTYSLSTIIASTNIERWRNVDIYLPRWTVVDELIKPLIESGRSLAGLESLSLYSPYEEAEEGSLDFPVICPRLRSLALRGSPLLLKSPCPSLRRLDIHTLTAPEALHVIAHCPDIQVFTSMNLVEPHGVDPSTPPSLTASTCSAFRLEHHLNNEPGVGGDLFRNLTFPSLTHLVLSDLRQGETLFEKSAEDFNGMCIMLERNHLPTVTHLTLQCVSFASAEVLRLLQCVASVTTLELDESRTLHNDNVDLIIEYLTCNYLAGGDGVGDGEAGEGDADPDMDSVEEYGPDTDSEDQWQQVLPVPAGVHLLPKLQSLKLTTQDRRISRTFTNLLVTLVRSRNPSPFASNSSQVEVDGEPSVVCCLRKFCLEHLGGPEEFYCPSLQALSRSLEPFREEGIDIRVAHL
ncbi:hypothetical protein D9757_001300 [Collybiopsis confluens]|uniref:F-box domain-containing protein n=1 Tax=Collybiopsis confluens TaxID=2823264 RepID=A0A8H5I0Y7_9AGAR|nr:hypothetical protein D9757_001300 [Collybiopsis confluens]